MKARIKSNGKIVEVISRFMPRKRNTASRDWVCNLSDGTCIDESQLEYIEESIDVLDEAANEFANQDCVTFISRKKGFIAGAQWQKEQMMKEAVEGEVDFINKKWGLYDDEEQTDAFLRRMGVKREQKVRIIIVKED